MILDIATVDHDVELDADVCVVGSGAGGAVVAHQLAAAGRTVVVVEEGSYVTGAAFTQREEQMLPRLYAEQGVQSGIDSGVAIARGRALGGSTVASLCVCMRLPRQIVAHWATHFGLAGLRFDELTQWFAQVEATAQVQPLAASEVNRNNALLQTGAARLGFRTTVPAHNRVACLGCGFCALGCAYARKADALTVQLPAASRLGAVIIPSCRVERIEVRDGKAAGVAGRFLNMPGQKRASLAVRAPTVVLAAGAIGSPALWLRSHLPNPYQQVGRNLHLHPQVMVGGVFADEIAGWQGIPQSVVVDEFLDLDRSVEGGYLLSGFFAHPMTVAALLPGFGGAYHQLLGSYAHLGMAAVTLHDRSAGHVELDAAGQVTITYHLGDDDRADILDGMRRLADVYFASGAQRVVLPYNEPVELTRRGDYRPIDEIPFRVNDPLLFSYHPQGTLRMGIDARHSVVNGWGEAHAVGRLFVADASIFPTSTAVPPQLSIMAFAARTARHIVEKS